MSARCWRRSLGVREQHYACGRNRCARNAAQTDAGGLHWPQESVCRRCNEACIGVAGAGREGVAVSVRKIVDGIVRGALAMVGDMEMAMGAAVGAVAGVIVIAGTGSIAYGRDAQGRTARAGGWGFAISDEGSAHWIGRAAVGAVLRAVDQEDDESPSRLLGELMTAWGVESPPQLARLGQRQAGLRDSVSRCAGGGGIC